MTRIGGHNTALHLLELRPPTLNSLPRALPHRQQTSTLFFPMLINDQMYFFRLLNSSWNLHGLVNQLRKPKKPIFEQQLMGNLSSLLMAKDVTLAPREHFNPQACQGRR